MNKIRKQILLLLGADNCKPITSKLHLDMMLKLVNDALDAEKHLRKTFRQKIPRCPKCGAEGIRLEKIERICHDKKPRYTCPNFATFLSGVPKQTCDVEYFNEDGAF